MIRGGPTWRPHVGFCRWLPLLILLLLTCHAGRAGAAEHLGLPGNRPWEIEADAITYMREPPTVIASGNVILRQPQPDPDGGITYPLVIEAEYLHYNIADQTVDASGNLVIRTPEDVVTASAATIDLRDETGTFQSSTLFHLENNLYLSSETMRKTGPITYHLRRGMVTTCPIPKSGAPPWSFHSRDTKITREGYALLKHVSFHVRDYPIFYAPILILPAKTTRQTGFLFPEYSQSNRDGTGLVAPFFVNLSPAADMTFYPGFLSERGVLAGGEFRYVLEERSRGSFAANYLHDDIIDTPGNEYKSDAILRTNADRYWLRGKVDHDFGEGLFARLDLDIVSDQDYLQEFRRGIIGFAASNAAFLKDFKRGFQAATVAQRENSLLVAKAWPSVYLDSQLLAVNDLREDDSESSPLWTLPRITFSGYETAWLTTPLDLAWENEYVYYHRDRGLEGHRLDLHPRLVASLPFGPRVENSIIAGLRETLYRAEENDASATTTWQGDLNANRTLIDGNATMATTLARDFGPGSKNVPGWRLRHLLRPELTYSYIQERDQENLPSLDETDRIASRRWLTYSLNNLFSLGPRPSGATMDKAQTGSLKISQTYDAAADDHPWADLFVELHIRPVTGWRLSYESALSMYGEGVPYYELRLRFAQEPGYRGGADYRYKRHAELAEPFFFSPTGGDSLHTLHGWLTAPLSGGLTISGDITHSLSTNRVVESSLSLNYRPGCWGMELVGSTTPEETKVALVLSLTGIGKTLELGLPEFY